MLRGHSSWVEEGWDLETFFLMMRLQPIMIGTVTRGSRVVRGIADMTVILVDTPRRSRSLICR
jgi:hypothetical protein